MRFGRRIFTQGLLGLVFAGAFAGAAAAQEPASAGVHVVTYFELLPAAVSGSASLLRRYVAESRSASGNHGFLLLQEIGRPNRFVVVEAWQDRASLDARTAARTALYDVLAPHVIGGFDARSHTAFSLSSPRGASAQAVYVVSHIDVFPIGVPRAVDLVRAESTAMASDAGNVRSDVLRWDGHPNHFTLVSAWRDRRTAEAGLVTSHTRQFRAELAPMEGAPYDGRLYRAWP